MSLLRQGTFSLSKPTAQVTEAEAAALTCLAAAQPAWSKTSPAERAALAKEVLDELGKDEWSTAGEWVSKELELQKLGSTEPAVGAASRFVFGSVIKDFCATFIAAAEGKKLPELPEAHDGSRRHKVAMGMAAPGYNAELWTKQLADAETPSTVSALQSGEAETLWRGSTPCAGGTVTLVLAAGNQGFLSMVEVLGRVLLHGDTVLIKHHPLRPWMMAPCRPPPPHTPLRPRHSRPPGAPLLRAGR